MCMTSLYHVLSFCRSYLRGARGAVPILQRTSKPRLGCPVTNTRYVFFLVTSPYIRCTIHRAHAKFPRPITCLSFRDIMDLAQKFERVACDKTISVTELDPNRKYRILRAETQNQIRSHCGAHYPGLSGGTCSGLPA
jgi:hypothetical protein